MKVEGMVTTQELTFQWRQEVKNRMFIPNSGEAKAPKNNPDEVVPERSVYGLAAELKNSLIKVRTHRRRSKGQLVDGRAAKTLRTEK